jgi:membrane-bound serine protease (ClpP class)
MARIYLVLGLMVSVLFAARAAEVESGAVKASAPAGGAIETSAPVAAPIQGRAEIQRIPVPEGRRALVYVIPIRQEINQSALFILRRGLKAAIDSQADLVLIDMNTPGGRLDITLEMMTMLDRFEGRTATFVDDFGLSAGALISAATRDIYFAPTAVVGAAAPVQGGGQEIDPSMREKILSALTARIGAIVGNGEFRYRSDVVTAMVDMDFVLTVEGEVLKEKGKLLALNADKALRMYGNPPQTLFASGTAGSIEQLLNAKYGEGNWERRDFEMTWSISIAQFITSSAVVSLLLGAGLLCLYIEFKTPGFGFFGISGGILLGIVFFGHHVAGLSGHEPALLFLIGLALVLIEIFLFPGTFVAGVTGAVLVLVALVWGMADIWPQSDGTGIEISPDAFVRPITNLAIGFVLSLAGFVVALRFLPKTSLYGQLVLQSGIQGAAPGTLTSERIRPQVGAEGVVLTDMHPVGEVEFNGERYEAQVVDGTARAGSRVRVVGSGAFSLKVEVIER